MNRVRAHMPHALRHTRVALTLSMLLTGACGEDSEAPGEAVEALPTPLAITADWVAGTLSYVDLASLLDGADKQTAVVDTIDLKKFSPGPLALELTPDGKKLLVAASAGFFAIGGAGDLLINAPNIPGGPGKFLVLDIDSREIEAEIDTGEVPMGIAVTPDGARAFVAHFGSGNMAVVDLASHEVVEDFDVGSLAEEVVFDDTGTVGIVGYSEAGNVRTFGVADPEGTLSDPVELNGDSAGVAFFPGTKIALVVQAPNPLSFITGGPSSGYTLIDVSDPSAPKVLQDYREPKLIGAYPAQAAKNRNSILVPSAVDNVFGVREYALENGQVKLVQDIPVGQAQYLGALGFAYDGKDSVVMAVPGQRAVMTANLETKATRQVPWEQDAAGPADVVVR
jgi:DNA-binding beta-propeller fold protein YncE